jgi:hypothetical protein
VIVIGRSATALILLAPSLIGTCHALSISSVGADSRHHPVAPGSSRAGP